MKRRVLVQLALENVVQVKEEARWAIKNQTMHTQAWAFCDFPKQSHGEESTLSKKRKWSLLKSNFNCTETPPLYKMVEFNANLHHLIKLREIFTWSLALIHHGKFTEVVVTRCDFPCSVKFTKSVEHKRVAFFKHEYSNIPRIACK